MNHESIGIVLIGRNEGERLKRAFQALDRSTMTIVYVDSNSSDGSQQLARSMAIEVVELDPSKAFSAARARNAGFERLLQLQPGTTMVQFLDGDCELDPSWVKKGVRSLSKDPDVAAVCGRRRERFPQASIYNQIIDDEWDTPIGRAAACGGDALMRVSAFKKCGAFDDTVAAGEEPELCHRFRKAGYRILRIDAEMSLHDAAITRFSQWWRRHTRSGYGGRDVQQRRGVELFDQELRSARIWTVSWTAMTMFIGWMAYWKLGFIGVEIAAAFAAAIWMIQAWRIAGRFRRRGFALIQSIEAGMITMAIKWANVVGQFRHWKDSRSGRRGRLIEYKVQPQLNDQTGVSTP